MQPVRRALLRFTAAVVGCAAVLAPSAVLAATGPVPAPGAAAGTTGQELLAKPGTAEPYEQWLAVSAISESNAWVVGDTTTTPIRSVVLHWTGKAWTKVAIPSPSVNNVVAVSGVSDGDAWLVGDQCCKKREATLVLHWNGKTWSRVASPNPAGQDNRLSAVSASSSDSAWAAGSTCSVSTGDCAPLLLHWNGKAWAHAASPVPGVTDTLQAVATVAADDAWAVGYTCGFTCYEPLVMHWNGKRWSTSAIPSVGSVSRIDGLAAVSATDVWAVGTADIGTKTVILHWNGKKWHRSSSRDPGRGNVLFGVSATSGANAWAVGNWCTTTGCAGSHTLIIHWNGTAWSQVKSPNPGTGSILAAVAATSASNAWAVGGKCTDTGGHCEPITLHWNGKAWSRQAAAGL
jgi:hypothetical protein